MQSQGDPLVDQICSKARALGPRAGLGFSQCVQCPGCLPSTVLWVPDWQMRAPSACSPCSWRRESWAGSWRRWLEACLPTACCFLPCIQRGPLQAPLPQARPAPSAARSRACLPHLAQGPSPIFLCSPTLSLFSKQI